MKRGVGVGYIIRPGEKDAQSRDSADVFRRNRVGLRSKRRSKALEKGLQWIGCLRSPTYDPWWLCWQR